jgi:hypothetical protein
LDGKNMMRTTLILVLSASFLGNAQPQPNFSMPTLGLVYDAPTRAMRSINGLPGAALLGGPAVENVTYGSVSPNGTWLVVLRETEIVLEAVDTPETRQSFPIQGASSAAWSSNGRLLAVSLDDHTFAAFRLDGKSWQRQPDIPGAAAGRASFFQIANSGDIWLGSRDKGISRSNGNGTWDPVIAAIGPVSFLLGSEQGVCATSTGVFRFRLERPSELLPLWNAESGETIAGIAESASGILISVKSGTAGRLVRIDTESGAFLQELPLDFPPGTPRRIGGKPYFLIGERFAVGESIYLTDTEKSFFVPPSAEGGVR